MNVNRIVVALIAALCLVVSAQAVEPTAYTVSDLGIWWHYAPAGLGFNDSGVIVTERYDGDSTGLPMMYKDGVWQQLPLDGSDSAILKDINNHGQIVGFNVRSRHGFLVTDGVYEPLPPGTMPYALNDKGVVTGMIHVRGVDTVFRMGAKKLRLAGPGVGLDINESGQVAGYVSHVPNRAIMVAKKSRVIATGGATCIAEDGTIAGTLATGVPFRKRPRNLPEIMPGFNGQVNGSLALSMNDAGTVVGMAGYRAIRWDANGNVVDLNSFIPSGSGWTLERAMAINNKGQIVCFGHDQEGQGHLFLLDSPG